MKNIVLTLFITLSFIAGVKSQSDTLINYLTDPDIFKRENALSKIRQDNLTQYIPVLVENTFEQSEPVMIKHFMETLAHLDYEDIGEIAYQFIKMSKEFENMFPIADPLEMKVVATQILFDIGDFSTVDYVLELAERDYPFNQGSRLMTVSMLGRVNEEVPAFEEEAKEILLQSVYNSTNVNVRQIAVSVLYEKYGGELVDLYIHICESDDDWAMRAWGLEILYKINYVQLNDLLRERITIDAQPGTRRWISFYLLNWFGEPADLKYVKDYLPNETDQTAILGISLDISTFIPPKPEALNWYGLATRLITYTDEMLSYEWIASEIVRAFYETKLNDIIEAVQANKIGKACNIINNTLLPTIDQHLGNNNITNEAYKFLHYYTIYIKEEIEEQFGACP
jgi:hypothetical protein